MAPKSHVDEAILIHMKHKEWCEVEQNDTYTEKRRGEKKRPETYKYTRTTGKEIIFR